MTDHHKTVILCLRTGAHVVPVEGSTVRWCTICGNAVWLSPHGQERELVERVLCMCMECGPRSVATEREATIELLPQDQFLPGAKEALRALRQYVKQLRK